MAKVAIIMGSDSDLKVMAQAAKMLDHFQVDYELTVVSAHRTVKRMVEYAESAVDRGIEVIIAGAGGAAHLPGMVAAITPLPVIGVPVKSSKLQGLDSLLSIVQMPGGIPVATVAIDQAKNAGILAASMLGIKYREILERVAAYKAELQNQVEEKAQKLEAQGYADYLKEMSTEPL